MITTSDPDITPYPSKGEKRPSRGRFRLRTEYASAIAALKRAGILTALPKSKRPGVIGIDRKEYPVPTQKQLQALFARNRELVARKMRQGFTKLQLTPLAAPLPVLMDRMRDSIVRHGAQGTLFQSRRSPSAPRTPVRVNKEKHVWVWEVLRRAAQKGKLVYFPVEYTAHHRGLSKSGVLKDRRICAFPGWSVGLVDPPFQPPAGKGRTVGGRKQLEIGCSPNEYRLALRSDAYLGETGKTLEDFIAGFIVRLESTGEVSYEVEDDNATWCLAQYLRLPYADVVPVGRWIRKLGRARLDTHRSNNKLCTKMVGASTIVRLPGNPRLGTY